MFKKLDITEGKDGIVISKIIDTDFEERIYSCTWATSLDNLVEVYERRNLNVASNVILYFLHWGIVGRYNIKDQIIWAARHMKSYNKYKDEIDKYILLI
jgi:hypothetical protein